ncbi:MAG: sporulation initiation factor Spo0A C-terminal domain-containing protein [Firmicutes bacterium]|nr:sporulation initiation factor Spo0A C-terminal domain-containing protein [Bacillota bacterium]
MRIAILDGDKVRMNENFAYFASLDDIIFLTVKDIGQLREIAAFADVVVVYLTDELIGRDIPHTGVNCYFVCEKRSVEAELKSYVSNAKIIEHMPKTAELYKCILADIRAGNVKNSDMIKNIAHLLKCCGINENHKGSDYIRAAVELCIKDSTFIDNVTKHLYPEIARRFKTGTAAVERNIRNAVSAGWANGSKYYRADFAHLKGKRPSNTAFLRAFIKKLESLDQKY